MDTMWTITITFIGGPVWGCVTGILTNLTGHTYNFWGYEDYLFALCNIATALITWLFCRIFPQELSYRHLRPNQESFTPVKSRHLDETMSKVFALTLLSFTLCFVMSILGGLITFFIEFAGSSAKNKPLINPASVFAGFGIGLIISRITYICIRKN